MNFSILVLVKDVADNGKNYVDIVAQVKEDYENALKLKDCEDTMRFHSCTPLSPTAHLENDTTNQNSRIAVLGTLLPSENENLNVSGAKADKEVSTAIHVIPHSSQEIESLRKRKLELESELEVSQASYDEARTMAINLKTEVEETERMVHELSEKLETEKRDAEKRRQLLSLLGPRRQENQEKVTSFIDYPIIIYITLTISR